MSSTPYGRDVPALSGALAGAAIAGCLGEASPGDPQPTGRLRTKETPARVDVAVLELRSGYGRSGRP